MPLLSLGESPETEVRHRLQVGVRPRLAQEAIDLALVDGADRCLRVGVAGEHDADHLRVADADHAQQLDPAHPRHLLVGNDELHRPLLEDFEGALAVRRRHDRVARAAQDPRRHFAHRRVVVDYQDGALGHGGMLPPFLTWIDGGERGPLGLAPALALGLGADFRMHHHDEDGEIDDRHQCRACERERREHVSPSPLAL